MLYKATLKPVWTYGIQLWEQHVTNETIHRELKIPTVKEEISKFSNRYNIRVNNHQNPLVTQLFDTTDQIRRLKRQYPLDLSIRFN